MNVPAQLNYSHGYFYKLGADSWKVPTLVILQSTFPHLSLSFIQYSKSSMKLRITMAVPLHYSPKYTANYPLNLLNEFMLWNTQQIYSVNLLCKICGVNPLYGWAFCTDQSTDLNGGGDILISTNLSPMQWINPHTFHPCTLTLLDGLNMVVTIDRFRALLQTD